ncbi:hypothetical protein, partial [Burkholderia pseudomallei]|uniref:hypothetical protein n=1 Tax=Burkholderia pseudomallei TaxID=28450 RepID=UPI0021F73DA5
VDEAVMGGQHDRRESKMWWVKVKVEAMGRRQETREKTEAREEWRRREMHRRTMGGQVARGRGRERSVSEMKKERMREMVKRRMEWRKEKGQKGGREVWWDRR